MALNYLLDPMFQIENSAGKPATDGWLEVYIHGTRTKYYCASNFDGTLHPFKIKLDSLGSNIVLADDGQSYDVYAYNRFGSLLMSRYNVQPGSGGGSSVITGQMQHWMGMYGPTYTNFPGDLAGHTLGIPRQSVEYDGDFIDHIETAPYPDGDVPAYIYLKPGLYHIDCVIRYQQSNEDVKNTLDEVLIYTGHGNANEDVAYQLDASGPDTNGNRHCLKQSFIRKVTEDDGGLLYFAPGTPTDWTDAYIQTLSIVKLDSIVSGAAGLHVVYHDETMTGDGTQDNPLSIQDALDGKQDKLTEGQGIHIDSDGVISAEGEKYYEGWGIDIDENNVISVDHDIIQQKLTPGDGIQIDSDGTITAEGEKYYEGWGIDINENNEISVDPDIIQKKITTGEGLTLDSDGNLNLDLPPVKQLVAGDNITIVDSDDSVVISAADAPVYTEGYGIDIDSDGRIGVDPNTVQEKLTAGQNITIDSDGVISASGGGGECLWEVADDGNIEPKNDKHFEATGAPTYSQEYNYYFALKRLAKSTDDGFEIDLLRAAHTGSDTDFGPYSKTAFIKSDMSADPYMGVDRAGLVINSGKSGTGSHPASRVDLYAGSNDGYSFADYVARTYVQAIVGNNYVRMRSDDIIRHSGSTDSHTPFITAQQSDTTKRYVLQPTAISGNYNLVESSGGGGGTSYTAGGGINIDSDGVISAKTDGTTIHTNASGELEVIGGGSGGESNVFIAEVGSTSYDEIKAAVDAGKVVIARLNGKIQMGIVSDWTDMWGMPAYLFGVLYDQYQGGFPRRLLYSCIKISEINTEWRQRYNEQLAEQSSVNTALAAKQDKLTSGEGVTIDSNNSIHLDVSTLSATQINDLKVALGIS